MADKNKQQTCFLKTEINGWLSATGPTPL